MNDFNFNVNSPVMKKGHADARDASPASSWSQSLSGHGTQQFSDTK